ncbi:MAG: hypothetical protein BGO55_07700 [Sphingobacteriales bacterium 50-39]|nr:hypothetical protein [Sphingobacteriales bacterium]OJW53125.1 MAG: hypothetical protein BGO55_07700 [Sphingobacteriales bacterium 50-39]
MIETYEHKGEGYEPFLIRDGWQVAQLNYMEAQDLEGIVKVDKHLQTDEAFILLTGTAVLIAATVDQSDLLDFTCEKMQHGITYNIPVNTWHNIAMDRDASVIIMERNGTHLGDYVYRPLTQEEQARLKRALTTILEA